MKIGLSSLHVKDYFYEEAVLRMGALNSYKCGKVVACSPGKEPWSAGGRKGKHVTSREYCTKLSGAGGFHVG